MPETQPAAPAETPPAPKGSATAGVTVARILSKLDDDPVAVYAAVQEIRSMAGGSVVAQITSYVQAVEARREAAEARRETAEAQRWAEQRTSMAQLVERVDGVQRELRLIWRVLFAVVLPLVALAVRDLVLPLLR